LAVEVARRHDLSASRAAIGTVVDHERVVRHGVELDLHHGAHVRQGVACGAVHLRRRAQRVGVLHATAAFVRALDGRVGQQPPQVVRHLAGARVRTQARDGGMERAMATRQRLDAHRRGDVRDARQAFGIRQAERQLRRHGLGAVDQRKTLLRLQHYRVQTCRAERSRRGHHLATELDLAFAQERQRDVGERREVS